MSPTGQTDALLMDIGADAGALVVYAPAHLDGQEVEIVAAGGTGAHPVHNVVRPRRVADAVVHAAVFPDLAPGDYLPYGGWAAPGGRGRLTVAAGQVLETGWQRSRAGDLGPPSSR